ncbi:uncharacterized protein G2W53_035105 [Senna tora]|uniref:Uncharacterized protein n=1 Tax=Senna tora TaxID=362788 RepID=A0A834SR99_9FABA|nr:uncharacterized protein G2W53_035105 [Senna tora]
MGEKLPGLFLLWHQYPKYFPWCFGSLGRKGDLAVSACLSSVSRSSSLEREEVVEEASLAQGSSVVVLEASIFSLSIATMISSVDESSFSCSPLPASQLLTESEVQLKVLEKLDRSFAPKTSASRDIYSSKGSYAAARSLSTVTHSGDDEVQRQRRQEMAATATANSQPPRVFFPSRAFFP